MSESSGSHVYGAHEPGTSDTALPNAAGWEKLDALLKDLPPGIPLLPPEDAGNFEKYTHRPRQAYAPGDGWKNCARALEKYDAELCKGYREEIDTLLVFAGLFSAVVTAFTIESYQWLQTDPNDAIVVLLSQIAQSVSPNHTIAPPVPAAAGLPGSVSVRINVYWFMALALSLSASLVAILCKQWIREFERNTGLSPKEFVDIHQTKLDGLEKWKVGAIVSLLPLLLQLALAIFSLGVLDLLWQLHSAVATVVCVPTMAAFVFYVATTVLPVLTFNGRIDRISDCPYKSPQARLAFPVYNIRIWISPALDYLSYLRSLINHYLTVLFCGQRGVPVPVFDGVLGLYVYVPEWHSLTRSIKFFIDDRDSQPLSVYRSLKWISWNLDDGDIRQWIWHCLWETALDAEDDPYDTSAEDDPSDTGGEGDPDDTTGDDLDETSNNEAVKRGFCNVALGTAEVPQSGLRGLALADLMQQPSPWPFRVEAFIQNISKLDAASAEYLTGRINSNYTRLHYLDAEATVAILKAAGAYGRLHVHEPIGGFLVKVAELTSLVSASNPKLRILLLGYTTVLYRAWLSVQPVPHHPSTVKSNEEMVRYNCLWLMADWEQHRTHPERLRQQIGVQELAQLLSIYAESHEDPVAALGVEMPPDEQEEIRPIVQALLEMARPGHDSAATAGDSALVLDAAPSPPLPHADPPPGPTLSRPQSLVGGPSSTRSSRRHSARSTLAHARLPDPPLSRGPELDASVGMEGEWQGVSGSSELRDSPTLRADAAHAPSAGRVQTWPSRNSADAGHSTDAEGGREAGRSATGASLLESAGTAGSHGSASLRAVIIHSPSDAGTQEPGVHQGAETIHPMDPGED